MSDGERRGKAGEDGDRAAIASAPPATTASHANTFPVFPRPSPSFPALVPIAHPPDPSARVVRNEQRSIRHHQQPRRAAPVGVRGKPSYHEIIDADLQPVLGVYAHNLLARLYRASPLTEVSDDCISLILHG